MVDVKDPPWMRLRAQHAFFLGSMPIGPESRDPNNTQLVLSLSG